MHVAPSFAVSITNFNVLLRAIQKHLTLAYLTWFIYSCGLNPISFIFSLFWDLDRPQPHQGKGTVHQFIGEVVQRT